MFNKKQQTLIAGAAIAGIVFMIGIVSGLSFGASVVWGLLLGGIVLLLRRQNIVVAGGEDIFRGVGTEKRPLLSLQTLWDSGRKKAKAPEPAEAETAPDVAPIDQSEPARLSAARNNLPDDLTRIDGVGPALAGTLKSMGFFHFDQIASWSEAEVAWMDENLGPFKGRVSRDNWVAQAKAIVEAGG
ncbi:MAG: NADH:ubiquinone oxidoreductase [Pseudomonadota bacterium]